MFWATILCKFLEIMKFNHTIVSTCCNHIWFIKWFRIDQILYSWFFKERLQLDYKFCVHIPWLNLFNIPARKTWYEVRSCVIHNKPCFSRRAVWICLSMSVDPCPYPLINAYVYWSMSMSIDPCPCLSIHSHVYWSMSMSIEPCPCLLNHVQVYWSMPMSVDHCPCPLSIDPCPCPLINAHIHCPLIHAHVHCPLIHAHVH